MVQRLSCEEVLLSTLTESSLISWTDEGRGLYFVLRLSDYRRLWSERNFFSLHHKAKHLYDKSSDGRNDEKQNHHSNWAILICVPNCCGKEAISGYRGGESFCFFIGRRFSSWNTLPFSNFSAHDCGFVWKVMSIALMLMSNL